LSPSLPCPMCGVDSPKLCFPGSRMRMQSRMFNRLPATRKLQIIVAIFVAIVICVFYLGVLRSQILSGVRAYVGGEGLWSKTEKRAVLSLTNYATSHLE